MTLTDRVDSNGSQSENIIVYLCLNAYRERVKAIRRHSSPFRASIFKKMSLMEPGEEL